MIKLLIVFFDLSVEHYLELKYVILHTAILYHACTLKYTFALNVLALFRIKCS